jgi:hypothetical protein
MTRNISRPSTRLRSCVASLCAGAAILFVVGTTSVEAQMLPRHIEQKAQVPKEGFRPKPTCLAAQLPLKSAVICNFGTVALSVSYWDGESTWQTVAISSGRQGIVTCDKCERQIDLSFHDGRATRQIALAIGSAYELYWAASGSWDIRASVPALVVPQSAPTAAMQ